MIEDTKLGAWLNDAKDGRLAAGDVRQVAYSLADASSAGDPYTKLYIVGLAGLAADYESLVAGYLNSASKPMLARIALQILCDFWSLTDRYILDVQRFVRGVPWDVDDEVRQVAISITGEYLRTNKYPPLFGSLLDLVGDRAVADIIREDSVRALSRALGDEWASLPPATRRTSIDAPWSQAVIERAYATYTEK